MIGKLIYFWRYLLNMKLSFWSVGKANDAYVKEGIQIFTKRINHYYPAEWTIIPVPKNAGMMSGKWT